MNKQSTKKPSPWITIIISVVGIVVSGSGWLMFYLEKQSAIKEENKLSISKLEQISLLLSLNKETYDEIYEKYVTDGIGILENYVKKVQKHGIQNQSVMLMGEEIKTLTKNNENIMKILNEYFPSAITESFKKQSKEFLSHAQKW